MKKDKITPVAGAIIGIIVLIFFIGRWTKTCEVKVKNNTCIGEDTSQAQPFISGEPLISDEGEYGGESPSYKSTIKIKEDLILCKEPKMTCEEALRIDFPEYQEKYSYCALSYGKCRCEIAEKNPESPEGKYLKKIRYCDYGIECKFGQIAYKDILETLYFEPKPDFYEDICNQKP